MGKNFKHVLTDIKAGKYKKTKRIEHVDYYILNKTAYSFHFYAVYLNDNEKEVLIEMLYDLRNKDYFIKRNDKEIKFNVSNLDKVVPRRKERSLDRFHTTTNVKMFFDMVSVEDNKGMYEAMTTAIGSLGEERIYMSSRALIRLITEYNKLELIYKAGIDVGIVNNSTVEDCIVQAGVKNTRKVHQVLGLTKSQLKFLKEFSPNHRVFASSINKARYLKQRDMDMYRGCIRLVKELEEKYNEEGSLSTFEHWAGFSQFIEACHRKYLLEEKGIQRYLRDFFSFIFEFNIPNPNKLLEYLLFECYHSQGLSFRVALPEYRDYYSMCQDLNYARFERYPRYLRTYHDIVYRNYQAVQSELENKKFTEATSGYKGYETTMRDYIVSVPDGPEDLVNEGNILHHCVASYIRNVSKGATCILFLRDRKEPEEPLVTVEIRGDRIAQARGFGNRLPNSEERKALQRFATKHELEVQSYA